MKPLAVNQKTLVCGLMYVAFGGVGLVLAASYEVGTALRMGPGYFPVVVSGLLLLVGAAMCVSALWSERAKVNWGAAMPVVLVIVGVLAFALLIEPAGFAAASLALVALVYLAATRFKLFEFAALYAALLAGAFFLFAEFLQLPLIFWPPGF